MILSSGSFSSSSRNFPQHFISASAPVLLALFQIVISSLILVAPSWLTNILEVVEGQADFID